MKGKISQAVQVFIRQATESFDEVFLKDVQIAQRQNFLEQEILQKLFEGHASEIVSKLYAQLPEDDDLLDVYIAEFQNHAEQTYQTSKASMLEQQGGSRKRKQEVMQMNENSTARPKRSATGPPAPASSAREVMQTDENSTARLKRNVTGPPSSASSARVSLSPDPSIPERRTKNLPKTAGARSLSVASHQSPGASNEQLEPMLVQASSSKLISSSSLSALTKSCDKLPMKTPLLARKASSKIYDSKRAKASQAIDDKVKLFVKNLKKKVATKKLSAMMDACTSTSDGIPEAAKKPFYSESLIQQAVMVAQKGLDGGRNRRDTEVQVKKEQILKPASTKPVQNEKMSQQKAASKKIPAAKLKQILNKAGSPQAEARKKAKEYIEREQEKKRNQA